MSSLLTEPPQDKIWLNLRLKNPKFHQSECFNFIKNLICWFERIRCNYSSHSIVAEMEVHQSWMNLLAEPNESRICSRAEHFIGTRDRYYKTFLPWFGKRSFNCVNQQNFSFIVLVYGIWVRLMGSLQCTALGLACIFYSILLTNRSSESIFGLFEIWFDEICRRLLWWHQLHKKIIFLQLTRVTIGSINILCI